MIAPPLTAADYSDWLRYAGLYLGNASHADRYRTYQKKISGAGVAAKIAFDFLESNAGGIDLQRWRNADVYEIGADAAFRVEETARSLEAIGAARIAGKIRTLRNTSLGAMLLEQSDPFKAMEAMKSIDPTKLMEEFRANVARLMPGFAEKAAQMGMPIPQQKPVAPDREIESWEQIEHLLELYVRAHEQELRGDMAKHGDVRAQPGFDPQRRIDELDRLRRADYDRQEQREGVGKLQEQMAQIEQQLGANPKFKLGKLAKPRRAFLEIYRKYADRPASELLPEMQRVLEKAQRFQDQHSALFRPKPIDDEALLKRLDEIGPCDVDIGNKRVRLNWSSPPSLTCDWTEFSLSVEFPINDKKALTVLLDAYARLSQDFVRHQARVRQEVLDQFEMQREFFEQTGMLDDYERDDDGQPTQDSILKHAGDGGIHMSLPDAEDGAVLIQVYFHVDWDDEHGLELSIDDEPPIQPAEEVEAAANVAFHDGGPAVTLEALSEFEARYEVTLPAEYRRFLLRQNGGRPEPNHLKLKWEGAALPLYVERLFPIGSDQAESLGDAIEIYRANDKPSNYIPIGRGRMSVGFGEAAACELLIGLTGKNSGKILTAFESPEMMMPGMPPGAADNPQMAQFLAQMYEQSCQVAAPNFAAFLARLTPAPSQPLPVWLQAIRSGDLSAFLNWLSAKGNLQEQFAPYGAIRLLTVLDHLALEAEPAFLQDLLNRSSIKPRQLRESWQRSGGQLERFRQLMSLLAKDQWHYAFAAHDVWDDPALLDQLLAAKVDLEGAIDDEGGTPLHLAVRIGRADGVRWLLAHGASASKPDRYGRTAILWAESSRELECLKVLLEAGESLESLFAHMLTLHDKLRLIKSRWLGQFDALADYLRSRGVKVDV